MPRTDAPPRPHGRSERSRPSIFWVLAIIIIPLISLMARVKVVDGHKMPRHGACVIAPNHFSEIDPVIVGVALWRLGRLPRFLAKAGLFRVPVLGWFLRRSGQIPVERAGTTRGSTPLKSAQTVAERGNSVIVYPEGSLTRDPQLWPMRGRTGAARMALVQGLPVIPIAHWGTQHVMARYARRIHVFPPKRIEVKIGDPVDLSRFAGRPVDATTLNEATDVIMDAITVLLADLRGEDPPAARWDPSVHDQKETGRFEA